MRWLVAGGEWLEAAVENPGADDGSKKRQKQIPRPKDGLGMTNCGTGAASSAPTKKSKAPR